MALQGYKALIKGESSQIAFTDEATTTSDNQTYQISDANKRIWGFNSTIVVEDAGVPTVEAYTISRLEGTVTFETANPARVITITGDYVVLNNIAEAKAYTFDLTADQLDSTVFQDTERTFENGLISGTGTISRFYNIDNYFINQLFNGETKVVEFYADIALDPFRVYANISADSLTANIEALSEESVSLQFTNRMLVEV